jgi:hypothetical protein
MFEATIRYIGGLLSAYELSGEKYPFLLDKAEQLANCLSFAWFEVRALDAHIENTVTSRSSREMPFPSLP